MNAHRIGLLPRAVLSAATLLACTSQERPTGDVREARQRLRPRKEHRNELGAHAGVWTPTGPGGGGALFSPSISPHDPSRVFVDSDLTAVLESDDFGDRWTMLPFRTLQGGVRTEVRFTADPRVLFTIYETIDGCAAPQSCFVVRSRDGGRTFAPLPSDPTGGTVRALFVDRASTRRLVVGGFDTIYYSDDAGASFAPIWVSDPARGVRVAGVVWNGKRIFVGTQDGLLVSGDAGATFRMDTAGGIPANEAMTSMAGATRSDLVRLFAVTGDAASVSVDDTGLDAEIYRGVYRLDWGRGQWTPATGGITADMAPFFVAMADHDADVAYLAGATPALASPHPLVLKTTDGGSSWAEVFRTAGNVNIATGWAGEGADAPFDWTWPERALGFAVSPEDPERAIMTDFGFAHLSSDGGATWHQGYQKKRFEHPIGSVDLAGKPAATNGLDPTTSWWVAFANPTTVLIGSTDVRGARSTDGGATWTLGSAHGLLQNSTYRIVRQPSTGMLYAATSNKHDVYQQPWLTDGKLDSSTGYVLASKDDGDTFTPVANLGHGIVWLEPDPNDARTMYASMFHGTAGGVYVTHDLDEGAAATWSRLSAPPRTEGHPFNVRVLGDGRLVTTWSGRRLRDGTFTPSSGVFSSDDGGASWSDRSDPGMYYWTKDITIAPDDPSERTWYVGVFSHFDPTTNEQFHEGGLYRTRDAGLHWQRISDLNRVESVAIHPRLHDVAFVSTEGDGLWWTSNLNDDTPHFVRVDSYRFEHPIRVFFSPDQAKTLWVVSFGGGVQTAPFSDIVHAERKLGPSRFDALR